MVAIYENHSFSSREASEANVWMTFPGFKRLDDGGVVRLLLSILIPKSRDKMKGWVAINGSPQKKMGTSNRCGMTGGSF